MSHLGANQVYAQGLSPTELIQKSKFKSNGNQNQKKKRGQKLGYDKPLPLRMNLVLEIRLLGKTILDSLPLEILLAPKLLLPMCDAPTGPCKFFSSCYE